jgi:hypothetical protein
MCVRDFAFLAKLTAGVDSNQKMRFAFDIYDINKDGYISNGELFTVMKCMVGTNLNNSQVLLTKLYFYYKVNALVFYSYNSLWIALLLKQIRIMMV